MAKKITKINVKGVDYEIGLETLPTLEELGAQPSGDYATSEDLAGKQDTLVSGTNIKTINGTSILGSGDITIEGGTGGTNNYTQLTNKPSINSITLEGNKTLVDLGIASQEDLNEVKTGVLSTEEKAKFDGIFAGNLPLPTPVITGTWSFFDNSEGSTTITPTPDANNPVIEKGYKVKFTGTYKWVHAEGYKDPTQVQSGSNWSDLPKSNVNSEQYESGFLTSNTTVKIGIQAAKTGLMVVGSDVAPASGMDTKSAQKAVSFKNRLYYGIVTSNDPSEEDIKELTNELVTSKTKTVTNVTLQPTEYYAFIYPSEMGDLSSVTQDDAYPASFTKKTKTITNAAGYSVELNVYISTNPGSFNNAKLDFK